MSETDEEQTIETDQWYWDDRIRKTLAPYYVDDETVAFVTVWHRDEVNSLLDTETMVPVSERGRTQDILDEVDSFRLLEGETLAQLREVHRDQE